MDHCTCTTSWLARYQAVPGRLACRQCGGLWKIGATILTLDTDAAAGMVEFIDAGGQVALVHPVNKVVYVQPGDVVEAPGRAYIEQCVDCDHGIRHGKPCLECGGRGQLVYKACPRCGDTAMWRYVTGRCDMHCDSCGTDWSADHPAWLAQRLPEVADVITTR